MRRRRASRIEANNRPGETGGGSRASERGKGAPGVSLCARLSRGVQLNELPVLVPLVPRNSRLSLFRFRLSRFPPPPPLLPSLFPPLELSSVSDPFKIRLLSCRLGCRRLWLKAIRAQRLLKRDHVLPPSLLKGFFISVSEAIFYVSIWNFTDNDSTLFSSI